MRRALPCLLALVCATASGCLWGDDFGACPAFAPQLVRSGRYRGTLADGDASVSTTFPAAQATADMIVDRDAGTVLLQWTAADGAVVVETRRIVTP